MKPISRTKFAKQLNVSDALVYKLIEVQDRLTMVKVKGKKKNKSTS